MAFPTIPEFYQPIQFGGTRICHQFFPPKTYKIKKINYARTDLSYGIRNKDLQGDKFFKII